MTEQTQSFQKRLTNKNPATVNSEQGSAVVVVEMLKASGLLWGGK